MQNAMGPPLNLKSKEEVCAATINAGTDLEMGTSFWNSSMLSAVAKGLVTEATVTTAARRGLMQRMLQGDFDPFKPLAPPRNDSLCLGGAMAHFDSDPTAAWPPARLWNTSGGREGGEWAGGGRTRGPGSVL